MVAVTIMVAKAIHLKAKYATMPCAVQLTFINEVTGQPLKKSSPEIAAVSYYERGNPAVDYIMPIMTKPGTFYFDG